MYLAPISFKNSIGFSGNEQKILQATLKISGKNGIHMRPAAEIVKLVQAGTEEVGDVFVSLTNNTTKTKHDASSVMSILLGRFTAGTEVELSAGSNFPKNKFDEIVKIIQNSD